MPVKFSEGTVLFAVTVSIIWLAGLKKPSVPSGVVALNQTVTFSAPPSSTPLQSTFKNTLCSILSVDMLSLNELPTVLASDELLVDVGGEEEMDSQDALEVTMKVKGMDPPMLMSTNLLPKGVKRVMVILGSGQL